MTTTKITETPVTERTDLFAVYYGPKLPGLASEGLEYICEDLIRRAVNAEKQALEAWESDDIGLAHHCMGIASACHDAAHELAAYASTTHWSVV